MCATTAARYPTAAASHYVPRNKTGTDPDFGEMVV
jgi:hypothetical protein